MTAFIATFPMYDWPETRSAVDADWGLLRDRLRRAGIDAPDAPARRNGDLPAVPGGILDATGTIVAPDPSTLPPDAFDVQVAWRHPALLVGQTCWGPMEVGLSNHVVVVGQPSYDEVEGGEGTLYSSAILMRGTGQSIPAPADGRAILPIDAVRGRRLALNGPDSMSGILALSRDLQAAGHDTSIFSQGIETGSHRASIAAVADGSADVCAIDCRSWHLARRYEPSAGNLKVVGWTARRKGLPLITSRHTPAGVIEILRAVLGAA